MCFHGAHRDNQRATPPTLTAPPPVALAPAPPPPPPSQLAKELGELGMPIMAREGKAVKVEDLKLVGSCGVILI